MTTIEQHSTERRDQTLSNEHSWIQRSLCTPTLEKIVKQCKQAADRLPSKISSQGTFQPEKMTLVSTSGSDSLKCTVTLMADNIIQAEVAIRYQKAPAHIFRAVAQPTFQWKLHQIQDTANYIDKAVRRTIVAKNLIKQMNENKSMYNKDECAMQNARLHTTLNSLVEELLAARNALVMPKKRSLEELRKHISNQSFNPSLPPDLALSFYIAGNRLTCASYHIQSSETVAPGSTPQAGGIANMAYADGTCKQSFVCVQADAPILWLNETITNINNAILLALQLRSKIETVARSINL